MLIIGILSAFNNINSNNISIICQINSYKTLFIIYSNNLSLYNLIYLILNQPFLSVACFLIKFVFFIKKNKEKQRNKNMRINGPIVGWWGRRVEYSSSYKYIK